jgi:pimeloyl-ACP methyl ester carboxylesterase
VALSLLALALAGAGCGGAAQEDPTPPQGSPGRIDRLTVRGQAAVLVSPQSKSRKVVVYTHGSGETVENIFRDPKKQPIFSALLGAGYAIAATDAHEDNWGSGASVDDNLALVADLRRRGLGDVYVLALSMGGFDGLALLGRVPVRAWAGIFPACDLRSVYDLGLYPGQIRSAYGRSGTRLGDAIARRSPIAFDPPDGLPMRFWASPDDRVIPKRENTDACAELARRRGAKVEVTTTEGDHGDPSDYDAAGVLRLFDSAGA